MLQKLQKYLYLLFYCAQPQISSDLNSKKNNSALLWEQSAAAFLLMLLFVFWGFCGTF